MIDLVDVTVLDMLDRFRRMSTVNRHRGTWFEELMVTYLRSDPIYADRFSDVWMWMDWPDRDGGDTGIDLVARERETGGYCAIQCKFYEPDHRLSKADIDSFFTASGKGTFTSRMIISTTDNWGKNAVDALDNQQPPVTRLGIGDLLDSSVNWAEVVWPDTPGTVELPVAARKEVRHHQRTAITNVFDGFERSDRGKLIMACGTGKTFTSLKIAEELAARSSEPDTYVLFLVPSISLLSQSLREWAAQCQIPIRCFAVCSDTHTTKTDEDISVFDLAFPATTDPAKLMEQVDASNIFNSQGLPGREGGKRLTVVFSTYHSIGVVHQAHQAGLPPFDLIICDEAHRTTGVTLAGNDESHFVKVHDNDYIQAAKRLYMTATPRLFRDDVKEAAQASDAVLCSMDDEDLYGPEFHRLGFGEAVEKGLLTDYKVLILTVDEKYLSRSLQSRLTDENNEISLDDAVKIVGCWNGLAKRTGQFADGTGFGPHEVPMRRAVAFNRSINDSKKIAEKFPEILDEYNEAHENALRIEVEHVDGTFNALRRNRLLAWLKEPTPDNTCRILSNVKCLSEGIDVPALDAVLFLNPRNSQVDVVQSVGRVMRKSPGKDYGYIILPVGIPSDMPPEKALSDNKRYKVVWQVLQALRAHDDRFNAIVNKIDLNVKKPEQIMVGTIGTQDEHTIGATSASEPGQQNPAKPTGEDAESVAQKSAAVISTQLAAFDVDEWRDAIYAKIVSKVGERGYWEDWAKDVALIAARHVDRINVLIENPDSDKALAFERFLEELRANINPGVTKTDAIDMLAQHLITKPVFDALFAGYEFSARNPVSLTMQKMLDILEDQALGKEVEMLEGFYASVRKRAEGIDNHEGRQKVITELYERFFKIALPKTADAFGIVYTPIPIVDFILRATNQALQRHFDASLTDPGVQILDPFTGTGTFIVRLLQSGLIKPDDLLRKYTSELHANEIVLLAYYIAAINIEAAFHQSSTRQGEDSDYVPFDGIVLTDTFQLAEDPSSLDAHLFPENNERLQRQKALDIRVIIGNPPYSAGQTSENDANKNQRYPTLDERIADTYAKFSTAKLKISLYDSYIRAIRWASDRIKTEGVIGFVSNGGYIDSNSADGLRLSLADEFSDIYCYNLRGNQRTAGELSRKEGGKIFGSGSRSTVAILILVKTADRAGTSRIHYRDIGDYLTREQKLATINQGDLDTVDWQSITPNKSGDWINQRDDTFGTNTAIGDKKSKNQAIVFATFSAGLKTNRDAWVCNYSRTAVDANMRRMIDFYNEQAAGFADYCLTNSIEQKPQAGHVDEFIDNNPTKISWDLGIKNDLVKAKRYAYRSDAIRIGAYRPFTKQHVYFDRQLNNSVYLLPKLFPTPNHPNIGFVITGVGAAMEFTCLAVSEIPDLSEFGGQTNSQFFPRWTYKPLDQNQHEQDGQPTFEIDVIDVIDVIDGYRRVDNITDVILAEYRGAYGADVTKDDIFYYVYGLLHSPQYRAEFAADLKKMLPRIPKVAGFKEFAAAGRMLADLHIGYETVEPYPLVEQLNAPMGMGDAELYRVQKMRLGKPDRSRIVYNSHLTLTGIPDDAYRYMLGSRSAIEWIIDRYRVKTDKDSGIVNDPNDWSAEVGNPRYIVDLLNRIVTVSIETMRIVDGLPDLEIID